jgi:hypothetical protein
MHDKHTEETQPAPRRKRSLSPQDRTKLLARIVDVILADPGKPTVQDETAQGDGSKQRSAQ